jgi:transcriptional regulator with XRE-family HTH domain
MDVPNLIAQLGTDAEAARKLGLDPSTVWRLRHGKTLPSHKTTLKLLELQETALRKTYRTERSGGVRTGDLIGAEVRVTRGKR